MSDSPYPCWTSNYSLSCVSTLRLLFKPPQWDSTLWNYCLLVFPRVIWDPSCCSQFTDVEAETWRSSLTFSEFTSWLRQRKDLKSRYFNTSCTAPRHCLSCLTCPNIYWFNLSTRVSPLWILSKCQSQERSVAWRLLEEMWSLFLSLALFFVYCRMKTCIMKDTVSRPWPEHLTLMKSLVRDSSETGHCSNSWKEDCRGAPAHQNAKRSRGTLLKWAAVGQAGIHKHGLFKITIILGHGKKNCIMGNWYY